MSDGSVRCWGANLQGEVGDGTKTERDAPQPVTALSTDALSIALGYEDSCARMKGGSIECWGFDNKGQLGAGGGASSVLVPKAITTSTFGVRWIALGYYHTCAVMADNSSECWGYNFYGQLGDGTTTNQTTPETIIALGSNVRQFALGFGHTCALMSDGSVSCWGMNVDGELGDGGSTESHVPKTILPAGSAISTIVAGEYHTCALRDDGSVSCWGKNDGGQIGDGSTTNVSAPKAIVSLGTNVRQLTAGDRHTCAIMKDDTVQCWGSNFYGQLGDGTTTDEPSPSTIATLGTDVQTIVASGFLTCAVMKDGGARCWGFNGEGELGDGTTIERHLPTALKW